MAKALKQRVVIAGHPIKVKVREYAVPEKKDYAGTTAYYGDYIHLSRKDPRGRLYSPAFMDECFLHELMHQVEARYECFIPEKKLKMMSIGLYQVLRDNRLKFW